MQRHVWIIAVSVLAVGGTAWGASFTVIPDIVGDGGWDALRLMSDGQTFVGVSNHEVFRLTAAEGRVGISTLPATIGSLPLYATTISNDGKSIIGDLGAGASGFRWTLETGAVEMQAPPGTTTVLAAPTAVSADGGVIVGVVKRDVLGFNDAYFRWTAATGEVAIDLPGRPVAISADGSTIVGSTRSDGFGGGGHIAYRWTEQTGADILGLMPDSGQPVSEATLVSADGAVVAGWGFPPDARIGPKQFRWTAATGMQHLGTLGDGNYEVAMSPDGDMIVGETKSLIPEAHRFATRSQVFVWTKQAGMRTLDEVLTSLGVTDDTWFGEYNVSSSIIAVSPDARFIYGGSSRSAGSFYDNLSATEGRWWMVDLSAAPEPSTIVLAVVVLLMIVPIKRTRLQ